MTITDIQPTIDNPAANFKAMTCQGAINVKENELNGLFPHFLHGFLNFQRKADEKSFKATTLLPCDAQNIKNIDLMEFIRSGRVVGLEYKQGKIEAVYVHPSLFKKIQEENAIDLAFKIQDKYILKTLKDEKISLVNISENGYSGMINMLFRKK